MNAFHDHELLTDFRFRLINTNDVRTLSERKRTFFLDFKETRTKTGALLDDDKMHFSKAASGFAIRREGFSCGASKRGRIKTGTDQAITLKPIPNLKVFVSNLNDYTKYSTEPVLDGIIHKVVFEHDRKTQNQGFAISYFPRSDKEHRSLGGTDLPPFLVQS